MHNGGTLIMHGEGKLETLLQSWFGKSWEMGSYRRCSHQLQQQCLHNSRAAPAVVHQLPSTYNVKAQMLINVPAEEALYAAPPGAVVQSVLPTWNGLPLSPEQQVAVAVAAMGQGKLVYFGDVNFPVETILLLLLLMQHEF
jgi:hypothetical protein